MTRYGGERVASAESASGGRGRREQQSQSSLPGLRPQVGFTRLAAHYTAQLGQARVALQSILFAKKFLRRRWTRESSPRVTEELRGREVPLPRRSLRSRHPLPASRGEGRAAPPVTPP